MSEHIPDRAALLEVFLGEAREALWTLAAGARKLSDGRGAPGGADDLALVAHRLKGSAALYEFPRLSELAGMLETVLVRARSAPPEERQRVADLVSAAVEFLRTMLKTIEMEDVEDATAIASFLARHPAGSTPVARAVADVPVDALLQELERFFAAADADVLAYFGTEAAEHLETMAHALRELEEGDLAADAIPRLLRAVHTLKGAAYTVGCRPMGDLAHRLEDRLVEVPALSGPPPAAIVAALSAGIDALRGMLALDAGTRDGLAHALERARAALATAHDPAWPLGSTPDPAAGAVLGRPDNGGHAADPAPIISAVPLIPVAPSAPAPATSPSPPVASPSPAGRPTVRVPVECLDGLVDLVGELVVARSRLELHLRELSRVDELLSTSARRLGRVVQSLDIQHEYPLVGGSGNGHPARSREPGPGGAIAEVFDELEFDRYSDWNVIARSAREIAADMTEIRAQLAATVRELEDDVAAGQRLMRGLRGEVLRARMVPFGRLFARFPRQVRELARAADKTVELVLAGTTVEVDSAILGELADPLLHLVQNAVVHGLEPEAERRAAGKSPAGTVHVRASHESGVVCVEVEDDGRGVDVEGLRAQAVRRELLTPGAARLASERELVDLMFLPGFTTAGQVTAASGRGIGLDVVRANLGRLNGDLEVTTRPGVGTRFSIRIPVTVLVTDALLVGVGGETFAIPVNAVRLVMATSPDRMQFADGKEMVWVEHQLVDVIPLARWLGLPPPEARREIPLVVVRAGHRLLGLALDELRGKEEIVIKPLGGFPTGLGPFASGTVSADGRVVLVLTPARLLDPTAGVWPVAEPLDGAEPHPPGAEPPAPLDTSRRFLLVDDSISVRTFVGRMLERAGFSVVTARDGGEALQQLETTAIHAVITDLEMPNVNGYELIEHLRRRPSTRDLPVVVLTTRGGERHHEVARGLGVRHYLTKPVDEEAFVELMGSLVARPDSAGNGSDEPA